MMSDTYNYDQSVIQGVETGYLSYFNGKNLHHFSFAYGRDSSGTVDKGRIGEEGDPIYIYGSSSYGNPYGKHNKALAKASKANINSCATCSDRRRMVV